MPTCRAFDLLFLFRARTICFWHMTQSHRATLRLGNETFTGRPAVSLLEQPIPAAGAPRASYRESDLNEAARAADACALLSEQQLL
jgi:hypothetical protein